MIYEIIEENPNCLKKKVEENPTNNNWFLHQIATCGQNCHWAEHIPHKMQPTPTQIGFCF